MGLLDTLRSLLGLSDRSEEPPQETTVSVEREPHAETEAAVKGSDVAEGGDTGTNTDAAGADDAAADGADGEPVQVIKGIGPAYADRLSATGVETVADLAAADVEDLAAATDLSEKRIGRWVERARTR
jgi:predicted flap endonuclease-1-like 5' DNA nuclease